MNDPETETVSAPTSGGGSDGEGSGDGVNRWLTEFHGQNDRLRAELDEARARMGRPSRNADVNPVAPLAPERLEIVSLADRLRADAEAAARLLLELDRQRFSADPTAPDGPSIDDLRQARDESEALRAALDRADAESQALAREVASLRAELDRRHADAVRLPVLASDLARWSNLESRKVVVAAVAVPVGPPPLPPSLDDIDAIDRLIETVRRLIQTPVVIGKPFHVLFDDQRFQTLQAKLREAGMLADRLISQVERSKTNKELLWHLMVARKNDEMQRKRR